MSKIGKCYAAEKYAYMVIDGQEMIYTIQYNTTEDYRENPISDDFFEEEYIPSHHEFEISQHEWYLKKPKGI